LQKTFGSINNKGSPVIPTDDTIIIAEKIIIIIISFFDASYNIELNSNSGMKII